MATHSNILAWKIPWAEEPGRLQSMGLQSIGHDWATEHALCSSTENTTVDKIGKNPYLQETLILRLDRATKKLVRTKNMWTAQ